MTDRAINPKLLLAIGGVALVVFSAIAIFLAVGYHPDPAETPSPATTTVLPTTVSPTTGR